MMPFNDPIVSYGVECHALFFDSKEAREDFLDRLGFSSRVGPNCDWDFVDTSQHSILYLYGIEDYRVDSLIEKWKELKNA